MEILKSLLTGLLVGGIFQALKLPIPAPGVFAGIVGIVGIFLGAMIIKFIFKI